MDGRTYGSGDDVVVVLHGGPGAPGHMAPVARMLADRWRVLEPFQRRAGGDESLTVAHHVADLRVLIEETGRPLKLVGSSWGAMLGFTFAARHPDLVERFVAVGSGTFTEDTRATYRRLQDERIGADGLARIDDLRERAERETDLDARDALLDASLRISGDAQHFDLLGIDDEIEEIDIDGHRQTWNDALRVQADGTQPAEFAAITCPVLLVHGDFDPHHGRSIAASLRPHVPHLRYVELDRCGHMPWLERHGRDTFLRVLRAELMLPPESGAGRSASLPHAPLGKD